MLKYNCVTIVDELFRSQVTVFANERGKSSLERKTNDYQNHWALCIQLNNSVLTLGFTLQCKCWLWHRDVQSVSLQETQNMWIEGVGEEMILKGGLLFGLMMFSRLLYDLHPLHLCPQIAFGGILGWMLCQDNMMTIAMAKAKLIHNTQMVWIEICRAVIRMSGS